MPLVVMVFCTLLTPPLGLLAFLILAAFLGYRYSRGDSAALKITVFRAVVVLAVLGIFAIMGTMQFFDRVERSRTYEALSYFRALSQSQDRYFQRHRNYAADLRDLDDEIRDIKFRSLRCYRQVGPPRVTPGAPPAWSFDLVKSTACSTDMRFEGPYTLRYRSDLPRTITCIDGAGENQSRGCRRLHLGGFGEAATDRAKMERSTAHLGQIPAIASGSGEGATVGPERSLSAGPASQQPQNDLPNAPMARSGLDMIVEERREETPEPTPHSQTAQAPARQVAQEQAQTAVPARDKRPRGRASAFPRNRKDFCPPPWSASTRDCMLEVDVRDEDVCPSSETPLIAVDPAGSFGRLDKCVSLPSSGRLRYREWECQGLNARRIYGLFVRYAFQDQRVGRDRCTLYADPLH